MNTDGLGGFVNSIFGVQREQSHRGGRGNLSNVSRRIQTIHDRHLPVQNDCVGTQFLDSRNGNFTVFRFPAHRYVRALLKICAQAAANLGIVIDYKNFARHIATRCALAGCWPDR